MDWRDMINKEDLGEPYASMYFLDISEICRIEQCFKGRQIAFRRHFKDVKKAYPELCLILGEDKARITAKMFSGEIVYFPEIKRACAEKVRKLIKEQFDGHNLSELSKKYGYSERHIRRITEKPISKSQPYENQISFFD